MATQNRKPRSAAAILSRGTWKGTIGLMEGHKLTVEGRIEDGASIAELADVIRSARTDKNGQLAIKAPDTATEKTNGVSLPVTRSVKDTPNAAVELLYASVGLCVPDEDTVANMEAMVRRMGASAPTA